MLDRIRWKLQDFMSGRNGMDDINRVLFGIFFVIWIVSMFVRSRILSIVYLVLMIAFMYRALSRNISARQRENDKFVALINLVKTSFKYRKDYKVYMCMNCNKIVRLPKNRGKVESSCPMCHTAKIIYTGKRK